MGSIHVGARLVRAGWRAALALLLAAIPLAVLATDVRFVGNVGFQYNNTSAAMTAERVENFSPTGYSGTLRLELWAFASPYSGVAQTGYKMAQYTIGQLQSGYYFSGINTGVVPLTLPPNGIWAVTMFLTEFTGDAQNGGYTPVDFSNFGAVFVVGANGPSTTYQTAVEYYHAQFGHYFVTASADEVAKLDAGFFSGWTRTGQTFNVLLLNTTGASNVCRFFSTSFAPKSSHFYTPFATECASVNTNPDWLFEAVVFGMRLPDTAGNCGTGDIPLYRLYNNGLSGAPNHRYTKSLAIRSQMMALGYIPEGFGPLGVIGCVPP